MANEQTPEQEVLPMTHPEGSGHTMKFVVVFLVLAALAIGEFYTSSQINSLRGTLESQQTKFRKDQEETATRYSVLERTNAQQVEALKAQIDAGAKRMGSTGSELRRSRALVSKLQTDQKHQNELLKQEILRKADQEQIGALTKDVSATRTDLDGTKKSVEALRSDLGMTRSEFGTLIARNHDDIEQLRKLGDRDYFEFSLDRNSPQRIAGVGLVLKKTNPNRHRFSVNLQADDMDIEKKDRTVNEPIFFFIGGSKKPYEMVVNKVQSNKVSGYLSTPKGAVEVATRSGGAR